MANDIWLSILVPVYNVEPYLADCIHSIARQAAGDPGIEIIMAEDVSTDGSRAIAEKLCGQYPAQLKLIHQSTNQGLSAARNRLLDEAKGEYVWFVDSDDYLLGGAVKELRTILTQHRPDLVLCDYRKNRFIPRKSFFGPARKLSDDVGQLVTGVFRSRKMYSWLKISRRSLWDDGLRFPVGRTFEDMATTPRLLLRASSFYYAPKPWLHYRQRAGSIMGSVRRNPTIFDEAKHDDMVGALDGYKQLLSSALGDDNASADFNLSSFCAIEFTKAGQRLVKAHGRGNGGQALASAMVKYRDGWQQCSPLPFDALQREYTRRLLFHRAWLLHRCLKIANAPAPIANGK